MFSNLYKTLCKIKTNHYSIRKRFSSSNTLNSLLKNVAVGEVMNIKGWIKSLRKQKENYFLDISDGSTSERFQVVAPLSLVSKNITVGSSISTSGIVQTSPNGQKELLANEINIYGDCIVTNGYPFAPRKKYSSEYVRQYLHFRPRTNKFSSLLRIRSAAQLYFHTFLTSRGYINVQTPILTSNDCEGAGEIFRVMPESEQLVKSMLKEDGSQEEAFFNTKAYLTVSGQLHLEAAAHGLTKVYNLGPTFRAENSKSRLHLAEFYMLEAEIAFVEEIGTLLSIIEELVKEVTKLVLDNCEADVHNCKGDVEGSFQWLHKNFAVLTYDEAKNILIKNENIFEKGFEEENGISKEHELFLVQHCGNIPTFLINWPREIKPFYMKDCKEDPSKVYALDLLVPGVGEVVGGSLRENNLAKLIEKLPKEHEQLKWYTDLRKFGGVPTAGYGLGFERYLMFVTGIQNIKDVIPFPRWPHNCSM
ncbi:asparaginyl-tRNA synthetase [Diabrotica undecimpunctata]|uniref:asparaginyl-tRNA synthetase n=1 Tax=Diabrotica undecimpunctata TaxID=50387 RepID=UPI003B642282